MSRPPPLPAKVVLKLGGELLEESRAVELEAITRDVRALRDEGRSVHLVHGGGPQTTEFSRRLGFEPRIVAGRRITDDAALEVLVMVVAGLLNVRLVGALERAGVRAVGLAGVSAGLIACRRRPPRVVAGAEEAIDFGHVGDVVGVHTDLLDLLVASGYTPVLSCVAGDDRGRPHNINADAVAADLAIALGASDLVLVTGTPGVMGDPKDPSSRLASMDERGFRAAVAEGRVTGGMIPKLEEALRALRHGVARAHILGHCRPGDLRLALEQPGVIGTTLVGSS